MHPGDRLGPLPDGATCTACGAGVPAKRIRILAHRDDLAFVELACPTCGSSALGILLAGDEPGDPPVLDVAADTASSTADPAVSVADVIAMHDHLASWDGDLRGVLAGGR